MKIMLENLELNSKYTITHTKVCLKIWSYIPKKQYKN